MTTKIPVELSSTPSIVDSGNATAITIDSSENVTCAGNITLGSGAGSNQVLQVTNDNGNFQLQKFSDDIYLNLNDNGSIIFRHYGASGSSVSTPFTIIPSGNCGIGTTIPSKKLVISDNGNQGIELSPAESGVSRLFSYNRGTSAYTTLQIQGADLRFFTNASSNTERLRILSSGDIGYSGKLFSSNATNTLGGLQLYRDHSTGNNYLFDTTTSPYHGALIFGTSNTEVARFDTTGRFGLGTSPTTTLSVQSSGANGIDLKSDSSVSTNSGRLFFTTSSGSNAILSMSGNLAFFTGSTAGSSTGTEKIRITSAGLLAINTTTVANEAALNIGSVSGVTSNEGGQLVLQKGSGGAKAIHIDNYNNASVDYCRFLKGTDTTSEAVLGVWDITNTRFGINTSTPQNTLHVNTGVTDSRMQFTNATSGSAYSDGLWVGIDNTQAYFMHRENLPITFWTNTSERMRIENNGDICIGTTAAFRGSERVSILGGNADTIATYTHAASIVARKASFSNAFFFLFEANNGTAIGSVTSNGSSTTYNTSSDYRLKENIKPMKNGLDRLNKLNPVSFDWKETGINSEGFLAHEVDEVFSDCVYGEKDGVEIQSMDYGRITPLLVKAIQEQQERIDALQSEINLLKGE